MLVSHELLSQFQAGLCCRHVLLRPRGAISTVASCILHPVCIEHVRVDWYVGLVGFCGRRQMACKLDDVQLDFMEWGPHRVLKQSVHACMYVHV